MFTAQEILVGNADYPTEAIGDNSRKFRQLGLGYANLGALLMAQGLPYDSPAGRAWAASLTALMTGHAYATSARTAGRMGPFAGYAENEDAMLNVLRMHRAETAKIDEELVPPELLSAAQQSWDEAVELGEQYGVRNSQATVLAPRVVSLAERSFPPSADSCVSVRSATRSATQWQDLGHRRTQTDEGAQDATQFYVNGARAGRRRRDRSAGYRLRGTTKHRIKVVDESGEWVWRRFADLHAGDRVPLALDQLVGERQDCRAPAARRGVLDRRALTCVCRETMTPELAELVGYFMGDGSLHAKGIRLCVADGRLRRRRALGRARQGALRTRGAPLATEAGLHRGRVPLGAAGAVVGGRGFREAAAARRPHGQGLPPAHPERGAPRELHRRSTRHSYAACSRPTAR